MYNQCWKVNTEKSITLCALLFELP